MVKINRDFSKTKRSMDAESKIIINYQSLSNILESVEKHTAAYLIGIRLRRSNHEAT